MTESDNLATVGSQLAQEVRGLSQRLRLLKRLTIGLAISFAIDLTITAILATVVNDQRNTDRRLQQALSQNYTTSQQQQQLRTENLCPLYQLLIGLADDPVRPPNQTAEQLANTAKASAALHKQYARLRCSSP